MFDTEMRQALKSIDETLQTMADRTSPYDVEHLAVLAMQGLMANPSTDMDMPSTIAETAISVATALSDKLCERKCF